MLPRTKSALPPMTTKRLFNSLCILFLATCCALLSVLCVSLFTTVSLQDKLVREKERNANNSALVETRMVQPARRCPYAVVYNKPGKTGSTYILQSIQKWVKATNRTLYTCSSKIRYNRLVFPECIKKDLSGCVVVAMHFELDQWAHTFLQQTIGPFITVTSTRRPEMRIISSAMQQDHITYRDANANLDIIKDILRNKNPWYLYNYHMGGYRSGSCPMSVADEPAIYNLARRYDVVIDLEHIEQSDAILRARGLWQLQGGAQKNVRGTDKVQLDTEASAMLNNVTCVENAIHRILRLRMAHLYALATGKPCLEPRRQPVSCF